jgi:hypothetical protein
VWRRVAASGSVELRGLLFRSISVLQGPATSCRRTSRQAGGHPSPPQRLRNPADTALDSQRARCKHSLACFPVTVNVPSGMLNHSLGVLRQADTGLNSMRSFPLILRWSADSLSMFPAPCYGDKLLSRVHILVSYRQWSLSTRSHSESRCHRLPND